MKQSSRSTTQSTTESSNGIFVISYVTANIAVPDELIAPPLPVDSYECLFHVSGHELWSPWCLLDDPSSDPSPFRDAVVDLGVEATVSAVSMTGAIASLFEFVEAPIWKVNISVSTDRKNWQQFGSQELRPDREESAWSGVIEPESPMTARYMRVTPDDLMVVSVNGGLNVWAE